MKYLVFLIVIFAFLLSSCSFRSVVRLNDQVYHTGHDLKLDVYAPVANQTPKKIIVFVHGGNWVRGKKSIYKFLGKRMARKDIVFVVIKYRLSPATNIEGMADDVATSVKWVKENSATFSGDTSQIFVSGHSAGGHLAAMVALDDRYFKKLHMTNPIKGNILIDAYGLDMYDYLSNPKTKIDTMYKRIFTEDTANWKKYSPFFHLGKNKPKVIQFVGGKTNNIIKEMNAAFYEELKKYQPDAQLIVVKRKRHVPMIFHLYNSRAKTYKDILKFIDS